ncbi:MAG: hypothetical protein K1X72_16785 [Pyrinomonadaceae bacterium]|nr:hypothetical protein [Pyrinomonadaceae bacterium]
MQTIKNIINWSYERASWQWDVLCILIMMFIFLTPKVWFESKEKLATRTGRVIVKKDDFAAEKAILEKKVKELSGNQNAEIIEWREKRDDEGNVIYEIDYR